MKKLFVFSLFIIALSFMVTSCGKYPQVEITTANAVIDSAKMVGTDRYLPEEFMAIQDSLKSALEKVENQKSKFLFRNYDEAMKQLVAVKELGDQAIANTEIKKVEVKQEAEAAIAVTDSLVTDDKALLVKAPKGKEGQAALDEIKAELTAVETAVGEAKTFITNGDFLSAKEKIMAAQEKASGINTELKEAIAKAKGKR